GGGHHLAPLTPDPHVGKVDVLVSTISAVSVVAALVSVMRSREKQLVQSAHIAALTDPLTTLSNRRALALDLSGLTPTPESGMVLVAFDLDGFKAYNDAFGHDAGDRLLQRLGHNLLKVSQTADARAYRLGGDEFCLLGPSGSEGDARLIAAATNALTDQGEGWTIGPSVGTVMIPTDVAEIENALVLADQRMYRHKAERRAHNTRNAQPLAA
ncbi:MAG: GGDEF domain-containing protein, partial [Solirubrobacteraceae bacterium]|nr:GGDEF domain-containing protein [Solirubrobacteraceae bacterium]